MRRQNRKVWQWVAPCDARYDRARQVLIEIQVVGAWDMSVFVESLAFIWIHEIEATIKERER
jgi:hypothetical protein